MVDVEPKLVVLLHRGHCPGTDTSKTEGLMGKVNDREYRGRARGTLLLTNIDWRLANRDEVRFEGATPDPRHTVRFEEADRDWNLIRDENGNLIPWADGRVPASYEYADFSAIDSLFPGIREADLVEGWK